MLTTAGEIRRIIGASEGMGATVREFASAGASTAWACTGVIIDSALPTRAMPQRAAVLGRRFKGRRVFMGRRIRRVKGVCDRGRCDRTRGTAGCSDRAPDSSLRPLRR